MVLKDWNVKLCTPLDVSIVPIFVDLICFLDTSQRAEDTFIWIWSSSGVFSVKSYYHFINNDSLCAQIEAR